MLLKRYGDIDYLFRLSFLDGWALLEYAREQDTEDRLFALYATKYAWMNEKTYVSFENFFKKPIQPKTTRASKEDIIKKVSKIKTKLDERRN